MEGGRERGGREIESEIERETEREGASEGGSAFDFRGRVNALLYLIADS